MSSVTLRVPHAGATGLVVTEVMSPQTHVVTVQKIPQLSVLALRMGKGKEGGQVYLGEDRPGQQVHLPVILGHKQAS